MMALDADLGVIFFSFQWPKVLPADHFMCILLVFPGEEVGIKGFTPPFLAPTTAGPVVLQGVNYASGGGGILNHTGKIFVRFLLSTCTCSNAHLDETNM